MSTVDKTGASDAEFQARVAPFEAAPVPEEVRVETVARAIFGAYECRFPWGRLTTPEADDYRRLAAAAIAAYTSPAEEAVKSPYIAAWLAAASREDLQAECSRLSDVALFNLRRAWTAEEAIKRVESVIQWMEIAPVVTVEIEAVRRLRAALASPAPAPHRGNGHDCSLIHPGTVCSAGGGIR